MFKFDCSIGVLSTFHNYKPNNMVSSNLWRYWNFLNDNIKALTFLTTIQTFNDL